MCEQTYGYDVPFAEGYLFIFNLLQVDSIWAFSATTPLFIQVHDLVVSLH